nr:MAG TPA: hypothetical protein [Caudoviricetes sp.]
MKIYKIKIKIVLWKLSMGLLLHLPLNHLYTCTLFHVLHIFPKLKYQLRLIPLRFYGHLRMI